LAAIVVVVFAVGVGLASGAIRFGGGSGSPGSSGDAFGYGSGGPGPSAGSTNGPGASTGGGSGTPAGGIAGCPTSQPAAAPAGKKQVVKIATAKGTIEVTLVDDLSPVAVGNFAALASCGYYDGVVFHRIVPGFVIQGGDGEFGRTPGYDPSRAGTGGPGYTIQDEPVTTTYQRGTVAMARTAQANSVGSQFFIVLADAARTSLASANTYQIIGSATTGMEVADAIAAAADNENPSQPIAMTTVTVASPTP
jgi:cyclophilin family peptidyl-prolyl cis-trans isomerase